MCIRDRNIVVSQGNCGSAIIKSKSTEAGKKMWVHMTNGLCDWRADTSLLNAYVENSEEALMWYLNRAGLTDQTEYGDGSLVDSNKDPSSLLHNDEKEIFAYMCTSQDLTGVWKDRMDTYDFGDEHCYFFAPWIGPKPQNVGNVLAAVLENVQAKNSNLETFFNTPAVKLVHADGKVTGVIAKDESGKYIQFNASKGVILACGGYSGNETMMNALQPQSVEQTCINYSKPGAKGDGIKACLWAGAIMDQTHTSMIFDRGAIKPDQVGEYGKANDGALFWMGSQPFLKVNLNGERFMNEYMPYDLVLHAAASQPYHTYCTVWDSKYPEDVERFATHGCSRLYPHVNGTAPVFPIEYIEGMNADLQDQGYIVQADTVEELADKLGLPKDTFTATVDRYNELAAKGEDEDYGKEDYRLSTLSEAPFYGVRQAGGYLICTIDGIQIDDNMHAIDQDFKAIPGLYVIGDMSGNYFSGSYPSLMAGAAAGRSATFGRFAGQNAAAGI